MIHSSIFWCILRNLARMTSVLLFGRKNPFNFANVLTKTSPSATTSGKLSTKSRTRSPPFMQSALTFFSGFAIPNQSKLFFSKANHFCHCIPFEAKSPSLCVGFSTILLHCIAHRSNASFFSLNTNMCKLIYIIMYNSSCDFRPMKSIVPNFSLNRSFYSEPKYPSYRASPGPCYDPKTPFPRFSCNCKGR